MLVLRALGVTARWYCALARNCTLVVLIEDPRQMDWRGFFVCLKGVRACLRCALALRVLNVRARACELLHALAPNFILRRLVFLVSALKLPSPVHLCRA